MFGVCFRGQQTGEGMDKACIYISIWPKVGQANASTLIAPILSLDPGMVVSMVGIENWTVVEHPRLTQLLFGGHTTYTLIPVGW